MGMFLIFAVAFASCVAVFYFLTTSLRSQDLDRMKSRLLGSQKKKTKANTAVSATLLQEPNKEKGQLVMQVMQRYKLIDRVQGLIEQAGLKWTVLRFAHASLALFIVGFGGTWYLGPAKIRAAALIVGLVLGTVPTLLLLRARKARLHKFEEQFPESLEFVSRSMRAGHAFSVSLEMLHKEFQEPLSGEFRRTFEEHNLGLPLDVALEKLAKRIPLLDVHFFVSAVLLQKRTGGNLAEILDKLAAMIRERFKLRGKIRAISAHGRMTGMALSSIPIGVAVLMFYTNPDYVKFFFSEDIGNLMLGAAITLQLIGYAVIQKIVTIEV